MERLYLDNIEVDSAILLRSLMVEMELHIVGSSCKGSEKVMNM